MEKEKKKVYTTPDLTVHGNVQALTQAAGLVGAEDGASKNVVPHHVS
jgi:hypothetical protein